MELTKKDIGKHITLTGVYYGILTNYSSCPYRDNAYRVSSKLRNELCYTVPAFEWDILVFDTEEEALLYAELS